MKLLFESWQKYINETDGFPTPDESYSTPQKKITPITSPSISREERIEEKERQFIEYALKGTHPPDGLPKGWKTKEAKKVIIQIQQEAREKARAERLRQKDRGVENPSFDPLDLSASPRGILKNLITWVVEKAAD